MSDLKVFSQTVEESAQTQLDELLRHPAFQDAKIRIMPDVHAGAGCVIGFTADLGDIVVPNLVGVDIGCGMLTVELGQADINFKELDRVIADRIPSGFGIHQITTVNTSKFDLVCRASLQNLSRLDRSLGTLGGGNHFIEIDADTDGNKYLVIHSGSRNLGLQVAKIYQARAVATCRDDVPDSLKYLTGQAKADYINDMYLCVGWARHNRELMAEAIITGAGLGAGDTWHTVHNYIDPDDRIIRKGAISAKKDARVLIPFNMHDGSLIATGKGAADWNCSAPHGAGRVMGRKQAKRTLDLAEFQQEMAGIYSSSVSVDTLDEAPGAYKPYQEILNAINATVAPLKMIRPLFNFKATQ